ncbi:sulfotransferase family 2 domain-containing protein [Candidatus Chloroploca asiatica]|uniref:Sulfotransferase domain-containing protein n=1 Tax=Candidatus Chloroploca asiatica TaxID=1506545 RepID=A0A2H3KH31_9CHLR|nr:sulfotransferase family 2 domain-containing protein [Candidatus Chloroploca asiatica]PDV97075.1 hypothetical protein A9Q02_19555 [Candidatus Chloroploca asiatica]
MNFETGHNLHWDELPVYFMHIPKTGGIALGHWLRSAYGKGYFDLDLPQIVRFRGQNIQNFRCYHVWHHGQSMYDWLGRPDLAVITMLPDPIERVVSGFSQWQRMLVRNPPQVKASYRARMQGIPNQTIQNCLNEELLVDILSNEQVRFLGTRKHYAAFLSSVNQDSEVDDLLLPYNLPLTIHEHDLPLLQTNASAWIERMAVVGLTERYTESLLMFGDFLGVPVPATMPRANVNPQRTDATMRYRDNVPLKVIERLTELNRYDLELYSYAEEIFEQHWLRYQRRKTRTYSIAPHLRMPIHTTATIAKRQIKQRWPGLAVLLRRWKKQRKMGKISVRSS